jgi:putative spermidine/putrescine transport system ATP-binding protein
VNETSSRGAAIELTSLRRQYGPVKAVDDVSLSVEAGEFMTLLGPSGSGKTTTLNLIAGFEAPTAGTIEVGGVDVGATPPHRRNLGVVFQNYALFPHLNVAANVGFALAERKVDKATRAERVAQALRTVDLAGMAKRKPSQLSGGQQQRVALASAMQLELRRIHREVGSTVVFVTHDQEEALALSDRIAVFNHGRIEQVGTGEELYERPSTMFIATFLGESTIFRGSVVVDGSGVAVEGAALFRTGGSLPAGTRAGIMVRPERLRLSEAPTESGRNAVKVLVTEEVYLGAARKYSLELPDGTTGLIREPVHAPAEVHAGQYAWVSWDPAEGVLLPDGEVAETGSEEAA